MKVVLVRKIKLEDKETWEEKEVEFNGNIIFPYYLHVLSIEHYPDKIVFNIIGKHEAKIQNNKLWITGSLDYSSEHVINQYNPID